MKTWEQFLGDAEKRGILSSLRARCLALNISLEYVFGQQTSKSISYARGKLFYWLSTELHWSSGEIADLFGRDRGAVSYQIDKTRVQTEIEKREISQ